MVLLLVGVHRAAEAEHGAVRVELARRRVGLGAQPRLELDPPRARRVGEDARPGVTLVDDRQGAHRLQSASAPDDGPVAALW
jgi:hypothetical protein